MPDNTPIQIQLSNFEKLEILRAELEDRQEELIEVETQIRDMLYVVERHKYLSTLSQYYTASPQEGLPSQEDLTNLENKRAQLIALIQTIEGQIPALLQSTNGQTPPPPQASGASGARKIKFDSFDDFRKTKQ